MRAWTGALTLLVGLATVAHAQDVEIVMLTEPDLEEVVRRAALTADLGEQEDARAQDYVAAARADYRRILTALYGVARYAGEVSITLDGREAASIQPLDAPARIGRVVVTVDPGPEFVFGTAAVAPLAPGTVLPDGFASGEPAASGAIREATRAGVEAWREQGHALAEPAGDPDIVARHDPDILDARVTLDPGRLLTFGAAEITGAEAVRPERIRAIAGLPVGTVYDPDEVARAETRLRRAGAFASANVVEGDAAVGDTLPMTIAVEERLPRRIGFGAEYSSIDGLGLEAYWLHRNLLGGAERLRIEGEIGSLGGETGGTDYSITARLERPATPRVDTDFFLSAAIERIDDPGYRLDQITAETGLTRYATDELTVEFGLGLLAAEVTDGLGTRSYAFVTAPLRGELDRRDDPLDPKSGYYVDLELTPFIETDARELGGRLAFDGRGYRSFLTDDRLTFAARGQLGLVGGVEAGGAPADFLFFSGGSGSVRGVPFQSLGVDLPNGDTIGGRGFAGLQAEARFDATARFQAVGFVDVGAISADPFDWDGAETQAGAGLGVRFKTGIGPIRLDLGTPIDGDDAFDDVQIYIGIGQAF
ncbi:MAG: autotransporter assembly complex protein TamA [Paracoccaceae bacterium]